MKTLTPDQVNAWARSSQAAPGFAAVLVRLDDDRLVIVDCAGFCWFAQIVEARFTGADDRPGPEPLILTPTDGPYTAQTMVTMTGERAIASYAAAPRRRKPGESAA